MPSRSSLKNIFCLTVVSLALFACGKVNDQSPALGSSSKHPDNWSTGHRSAYRQTPDQCRDCHGIDLKGGITKVDCFNQAGLGQCHADKHGPRTITHQLPFTNPLLHGVAARKDLAECHVCHGVAGTAGSNPRFNLAIGSLIAGCESSGCHSINMAHPKLWTSHKDAGNQANACALCHGVNFGGGSGPSCKSCHIGLLAGQLPQNGMCTSCHANGITLPNLGGSHAAHLLLPEMSHNCQVCHSGGGMGSLGHYKGTFGNATSSILFVFNAKSGTASYNKNSKSCSSVKCHGGRTTPAWGTSLDVTIACSECHSAGTAQYNGYWSGQHTRHVVDEQLACTVCHLDMANIAGHFSNLSSVGFNPPAKNTLRSNLNYASPSCTVAGNAVCHTQKKDW